MVGLETTKGHVSAGAVHLAPGGWSSEVARLAGLELPLFTQPLQAMVTECVKPFLDHVVISEMYFCYVHQTIKGDLVMGAHLDPWQSYGSYNTYEFAQEQAHFMLQMFPDIAHLKLMRSWSGLCDMTPDGAPIMGETGVQNLFIDAGWGYFGFKASPGCGKVMAEHIVTGRCPETIAALGMERFYQGRMVPEVYVARRKEDVMGFLIPCPNCGLRDVYEFRYGGEAKSVPDPSAGLREWRHYAISTATSPAARRNGWYHGACESWLFVERDTTDNTVHSVTRREEAGGDR